MGTCRTNKRSPIWQQKRYFLPFQAEIRVWPEGCRFMRLFRKMAILGVKLFPLSVNTYFLIEFDLFFQNKFVERIRN
jgi:hypothetical protein